MPIYDPSPISKDHENGTKPTTGRLNEVVCSLGYIGGSLFDAAEWVVRRPGVLISSIRHSAWIGELAVPLRDIDIHEKFWDLPKEGSEPTEKPTDIYTS